MKKFVVLTLFGLLIMAFSTSVYAQKVDFKVSGFIFVSSFLAENVPHAYDVYQPPAPGWLPPLYGPSPLFDPSKATTGQALNKTRSFMQERGILRLDAAVGKELTGTIIFEMDSAQWGEVGTGRNFMGKWNADQAAVEIKNIYIDVALPYFGIPVPVTARAGVQALSIRPHMTGYADGAGISGGIKIDPVTIQPLWFKALENLDYSSDDVDIYGVNVFGKFGQITAGGYGLYNKMRAYPLVSAVTSNVTHKGNILWLGTYLDGKIGPVDMNFDLVMDTGKIEAKQSIAHEDVKYQGWAGRLKIDYPWEKFNFGVAARYASGSDQKKTSNTGLPGTTTPFGTPSSRVSGYVVQVSSEGHPFGDSLLLSGDPIWNGFMGLTVLNYSQLHRGTIGGTWTLKTYGSVKAASWYKVTLAGIYIGDTTRNGNTMGNARMTGTSLPRDDKTIGFELDLINEIQIYKNLQWNIGFGYMFAGKALDYFSLAKSKNIDGKDPWAFVTRLTYSF